MDEIKTWKKQLSPEQATVKIRHYCAFQERTHQEVKIKLSSYGLSWADANQIMSSLIEEGFLNEERFAKSFVGGKFRMKGWGRKKIEMELKKRQVSSYSIQKALREEIDPNVIIEVPTELPQEWLLRVNRDHEAEFHYIYAD